MKPDLFRSGPGSDCSRGSDPLIVQRRPVVCHLVLRLHSNLLPSAAVARTTGRDPPERSCPRRIRLSLRPSRPAAFNNTGAKVATQTNRIVPR